MTEQILFCSIAFFGACYFLICKRKFDYFAVAYFSACVYFMPGFFGFTAYHINGYWANYPLNPDVYLIMSLVLISIFLFALIGSRVKNIFLFEFYVPSVHVIIKVILLMSFAGLIALVLTAGDAIHATDKNIVAENLGRWHILFYTTAAIGLPLAFSMNQLGMMIPFVFLLFFDLYLGFRSAMAVGFLSIAILYLVSKPRSRLIFEHFVPLIFIAIIAVFFFLYKTVAFSVKLGSWDVVVEALRDSETYEYMITRSEPFATQQILNSVISENFKVGLDNIFSVFGQLLLFGPELGLSLPSFNDLFQPTLFPSVDYGLASNVWAQMWSAGGWYLLFLFLLVFNVVLVIGNATLESKSIAIKAGCVPMFLYWAFYIHRNDIGYIVNIEKRIFIILCCCTGFAYLLKYLNGGPKKF